MAKSIKHTVVGVVGVRKSPRTYTHAIVAQTDWDQVLKNSIENAVGAVSRNWLYYSECDRLPLGGEYVEEKRARYNNYNNTPIRLTVDDEMKKSAAAFFKHWGRDKDAALVKAERGARDLVAARRAQPGAEEAKFVIQWSQSAANAQKGISRFNGWHAYRNIHVEPVVRHE